jgi:hypothetical protein
MPGEIIPQQPTKNMQSQRQRPKWGKELRRKYMLQENTQKRMKATGNKPDAN